MLDGQNREPGWPREWPRYVSDVLKALVVQLFLEVVRRWLGH
jgi:hypothetical protein